MIKGQALKLADEIASEYGPDTIAGFEVVSLATSAGQRHEEEPLFQILVRLASGDERAVNSPEEWKQLEPAWSISRQWKTNHADQKTNQRKRRDLKIAEGVARANKGLERKSPFP